MTTSDWIGGSGDWSDAAGWSNGVPNDSSAIANLDGSNSYTLTITGPIDGASPESFTVGTLDITDPNATLKIDGTLTVASEIDISAGTLSLAGTIVGGTIKQTGGALVLSNTGPDWTGTLDGVTVQGTLDLSGGYSVNIKDGLTVTGAGGSGPGIVNATGAGSALNFYGTQTFDNATINIGGSGFSSSLYAYDENGAPATLTLGPNVTIDTTTSSAGLGGSADATIVNEGTIVAETNARTLFISDVSFDNKGTIEAGNGETVVVNVANFTNTGTIDIGQRSTLKLYGHLVGSQLGTIDVNGGFVWLEGPLNNAGHVLAIGTGSALGTVSLYSTITGGTIKDSGGGLSFVGNNAGLSGVTYRGTLAIDEGGVTITNGLKLRNLAGTGPGEFDIGGGLVQFQGTQTLNNATIKLGQGPAAAVIDAETAPGGSSGTLTFGAGLTLLATPYAYIGGNGQLVNRGKIITDGNGDFTVTPGSFVNRGAIIVAGGETMTVMTAFTNDANIEVIKGLLDLRAAAGGSGNYQLDAAGTLEFDSTVGSGQIVKFYRTGGTLKIGAADAFKAGGITGFASGDSIDLMNVTFGSATKVNYTGNTTGGTLVVSDGTHTAQLKLIGDFTASAFAAASDGASGTTITYNTGSAASDAALHSKLHQFTAAVAAHSADAAFGAANAEYGLDGSPQRTVLAASWHH